MSTKQIYFQEDWLQNVQYSSWLKRKDDKKVAYYAKCQNTIELSNMEDQALKSHMKVKKHFKNAETIQCFFRPTKKANDNNEISTVHMPNSSQIQTNKTK